MRSATHFMLGLAAVSCLPEAVRAGAAGHPLPFLLGGAAALLPDAMDHGLLRFLSRADIEVTPDPLAPDPAVIAEALSAAVARALVAERPVRVRLNAIRLGEDQWLAYAVRFDPAQAKVAVTVDAIVDGDDRAVADAPRGAGQAEVSLPCPVKLESRAAFRVGAGDGALVELAPRGGRSVTVAFDPWRGGWSHSLLAGLLLSLAAAAAGGWVAGAAVALGYGSHLAADHLGFPGCPLLHPFRRRRLAGFMLVDPESVRVSVAAAWGAAWLTLWNLARWTPDAHIRLSAITFACLGLALPLALLLVRWPLARSRSAFRSRR